MKESHTLIAFLATLAAIVLLVLIGAYLGTQGRSTEALGIGGAVTGLIGVIGTFKPRTNNPDNQDVTVTNKDDDAIPIKDGETK